ncbi:MAG: EAL domain-containing protein, partial [Planctomycetes bacterium]|nr:EAL domain-containing protein [Planctomycetota bacterium]
QDLDAGIETALGELGEFSEVDRAYLFLFSESDDTFSNTHEWVAPGTSAEKANLQNLPTSISPWWIKKILAREVIHFPDIQLMPPEASAEKKILEAQEIQSILVVPLHARSGCLGFLGFDAVREARVWPEDILPLLQTVGEIFGRSLEDRSNRQHIEESRENIDAVVQSAPVALFALDPKGHFLLVEGKSARGLGLSNKVIGESAFEFFSDQPRLQREFERALAGEAFRTEFHAEEKVFDLQMRPVFDDSSTIEKVVVVANDITEKWHAELQLEIEKLYDSLTGLPNRSLLIDRVRQTLMRRENGSSRFAMLVRVDLDKFGVLNDSLGVGLGDRFLLALASCMEGLFPTPATVARMGADDFAILLDDLHDLDDAAKLCLELQDKLKVGFEIDGRKASCSASIGMAPWSPAHASPEEWLRDAESAMSSAQNSGGARQEFFSNTMHVRAVSAWRLEEELRAALDANAIKPWFQPIVTLEDQKTVGYEALARWEHGEEGWISPGLFIPVAEDSGLITHLGITILQQACAALVAIHQADPQNTDLWVSVNLAARQLEETDLVQQISEIVSSAGLEPKHLKLEVTETAFIQQAANAAQVLTELRDLGFRISLDDFGTGYSSLSYLHEFPVNTIKIDRSFVVSMTESNHGREIIRTILLLAQGLNFDVIAEGIETEEQHRLLQAMGCGMGQGYLFARPAPPEQALQS